jgi:branched-chain amino acid transport system permease protein
VSDVDVAVPVTAVPVAPQRTRGFLKPGLTAAGTLVALAVPFYLDRFWLTLGLFAFAAAVAALGLGLLLGQAGQLSLGHAFFVGVGAYGYTYFAGTSRTVGVSHQAGLGLPPILAVVLAVLVAGLAGLLFSPVAARLRGIYLGIASLALVFAGQHILANAPLLTGGYNGRTVPPLTIGGFGFDDGAPGTELLVLGVPFHREERLWYLGLAVTALAYLYHRNLVRGRPGIALRAVRDGELMAGMMGVPVTRYKGYAFLVSSMYAGLGGVLLALAFGRIVPVTFDYAMSIEFLVMVVLGGLGSAAGAIAGAFFVASLPRLLDRYADVLPGLADPGGEGVSPAIAARFGYAVVLILLLLIEPGGAAGLGRRIANRLQRNR